jgi:hypothetical protein
MDDRKENCKLEKRLPGLLIHRYGFSHLTFSLMMSLAIQYYTIFLTDVALIKIAHVPIIIFMTHIVDPFSIPVSGVLIQYSQFRWGQFRSWLLLPPLATSVFFYPYICESAVELWNKINLLFELRAHARINSHFHNGAKE